MLSVATQTECFSQESRRSPAFWLATNTGYFSTGGQTVTRCFLWRPRPGVFQAKVDHVQPCDSQPKLTSFHREGGHLPDVLLATKISLFHMEVDQFQTIFCMYYIWGNGPYSAAFAILSQTMHFPNPDQLIIVPKPKHSISTVLWLERNNKVNLIVPKVATKKWNPTAVCATGSSSTDPWFSHLEPCVVGHDGFVFPLWLVKE